MQERVGIGTGNSRQSGANYDLFYVNLTIPYQRWIDAGVVPITDITYLKTAEGWLYLAAILDLWSRRIVGWACAPTLHASLVLAALTDALQRRHPTAGLLHHSDRGSQYVDGDYLAALHPPNCHPRIPHHRAGR